MSKRFSESLDTQTPSITIPVVSITGIADSAKCSPRRKVSSKSSSPHGRGDTSSTRFSVALSKALVARSRFLRRRLTRSEFTALTKAVRRQICRRFSSIVDKVLSTFSERISRLEKAVPQSPLELQDSIGMFAAQVSVLREQALIAMQERDEVSETCGHFSGKRVFLLKGESPVLFHRIIGMDPIYLGSFPSKQVLACERCVLRREEVLFYWTGSSWDAFDVSDDPRFVSSGLSKVRPLSVQSVWTEVLDKHYDRRFKTPVS